MYRAPAYILGVLLILLSCSDGPAQVEERPAAGITFNAAGLHAFSANGLLDPDSVLARSFALAFADSLQGLVAMGFSATGSGVGDILILQFPRQSATYSCGSSHPCHGRLLTGVRLFEHEDGVTGWTMDRHFEVQSGSVVATEVGPSRLRGTFQVVMQASDGTTLQITDGGIDVQYNSTPPPPGQSMRGIECLLRLAAGEQITCN